ncbi:MAG: hypothetical protein LJE56_08465 [Acidiferrobacterales bacterium]|nr:hypothetical protein [Acidiferrobacterales bacterium]
MKLRIEYQLKEKYLDVVIEGIYDLPEAKTLLIETIDYAIQHNQDRILVDYRNIEGGATLTQSFDYVTFLVTQFRKKINENGISGMRMAYVGRDPMGKFGEMVATNRGVAGKYTTDVNEAIEWLSAEES